MRILIIYQHFLRPGEPGHTRFNDFAERWAAQGHEVAVMAGQTNYLTGAKSSRRRFQLIESDHQGQVAVYRAWTPGNANRTFFHRLLGFAAFALTASLGVLRGPRPKVILVSSPPLTAVIPAWIAAWRWRAPVCLDVRDLWPESAITTGVIAAGGWQARLLGWLERRACRHARRINVLTPAFRESLVRRGLKPAEEIAVIPTGASLERFCPGPRSPEVRRRFEWGDRYVALYAGAHGRANGLEVLLEAARCLADHPEILLATVGSGMFLDQLRTRVREEGLTNLRFHGPQANEEMPDVLRSADLCLAILQDNPTFRSVYPSKIFEYLGCARPVVTAIDGLARHLVEESGGGVFARPGDGTDLAAQILDASRNPARGERQGLDGHAYIVGKFSRGPLSEAMLGLLEAAVRAPKAAL